MLPPDGSIDPDTPPMNNRGYRIVLYKYFSFRGKRSGRLTIGRDFLTKNLSNRGMKSEKSSN